MFHPALNPPLQSSEYAVTTLLNERCACVSTDVEALRTWLERDLRTRGLSEPIVNTHPHLFSALPVFVAQRDILQMQRLIQAIETVVALPAYRESVLERSPAIARRAPAARGMFLGYDFHLTESGPKLIEINTNAGGGMLCTSMMRAQRACCAEAFAYVDGRRGADEIEDLFFEMLLQEWHRARGDRPLSTIAIVDNEPARQYLFPEFLLFAAFLQARGLKVIVADPGDLFLREGKLWCANTRVDLVYNRLTDFYFEEGRHTALAQAYLEDAAVITPHPHAYAIFANKHNLVLLSNESELRAMGANGDVIEALLASVPSTVAVRAQDEERWWSERKRWFFKPATGYGSRGSYRGGKLTRKVFAEILSGDYVAQKLVPPSERRMETTTTPVDLKIDIRNYAYAGATQLLAARLYQGQTTNFRTAGGGFAPVYATTELASELLRDARCTALPQCCECPQLGLTA